MRAEIHEIRKLAKQYGVKVKFVNFKGDLAGQCDYDNKVILLNRNFSSRSEILCGFFHETAHWICMQKGLWKDYHNSEDHELKLKTALKAEKWCDHWASHELYKYDSRVRYLGGYIDCDNKTSKEFLRDYYLSFDKKQ